MTIVCQTSLRKIALVVLISVSSYLSHKSFCQNDNDKHINAGVSGKLNCVNKIVTLQSNLKEEGLTVEWQGPNGFVSTAQNPKTTIPGKYDLSISNSLTGAFSKTSVIVELDTISPSGVLASSFGILTCKDTLIVLNGSSTTPNVTYQWNGPGGFTSCKRNFKTAISGNYSLMVTNPVNGCIYQAKTNIDQDINPPENVNIVVAGELNCLNSTTKLIGTTTTKSINYKWEGPGEFSSSIFDPVISTPGKFCLTVTKISNGCTVTKSILVKQNTKKPKDVEIAVNDTLTCTILSVKLKSMSKTPGVSYKWIGPNDFYSDEQNIVINKPGKYKLMVSNPANGCVTTKFAEVAKNVELPDIRLAVSGMLTCKDSIVSIKTSSSVSNLKYKWKGPKNFSSMLVSPAVNIPGEYTIHVTNPMNGCSFSKSVKVVKDVSIPGSVKAISSGIISCDNSPVMLTGKCETANVIFKWQGPDDFTAVGQSIKTSLKGSYKLTVVKLDNGCASTADVNVVKKECPE